MIIDPKLKAYIRPLSEDEFKKLEASITRDGCRDALVVWDGILIDGHNRYEICTTHGIEFDTVEMAFKNIDEAKEWMLLNQLGRRNLSDYDRTIIALALEELYAARGKANMIAGAKNSAIKGSAILHNPNKVDTLQSIADIAKVSRRQVAKVKKIQAEATDDIKKDLAEGSITINKAHQKIAPPKAKKDEPVEYPKEKFELDNAHTAIAALQEENQSLNDRLAVKLIDGSEEEKLSAEKIISDLRFQIVVLNKEIAVIRANRDTYLTENTEMKKQIRYLQKQLKKGE